MCVCPLPVARLARSTQNSPMGPPEGGGAVSGEKEINKEACVCVRKEKKYKAKTVKKGHGKEIKSRKVPRVDNVLRGARAESLLAAALIRYPSRTFVFLFFSRKLFNFYYHPGVIKNIIDNTLW